MVRRSKATVVLATLAAVLVANLEPCGAQDLQADGPPPECIPSCKEDGRWGIPCEGFCEWYVECKNGLASKPIKCGKYAYFLQMYFDNTKHECRTSTFWNSVDCNWWVHLTTAAPPITPSASTSSSLAPTTTPSAPPTTTSHITDTTSSTSPRATSITPPHTTIPTSNPPSNSTVSTTPSSSESTTPSSSESTTPGSSESTTPSSSESTTPSSTASTSAKSDKSTTAKSEKPTPPPPTPGSADRASAAVSALILVVGLVVL